MKAIITKIRIMNFRSIEEQEINLTKVNVIVGKNNSGKSNLIKAFDFALSYTFPTKDDVYSIQAAPYNEDKKIIVDLKLRPINADEDIVNKFDKDFSSSIGSLLSIDDNGKAYFAFRSISEFDKDKERYTHNKYHINNWKDNIDNTNVTGERIPRELFDNIVKIYMDAQRDISNDIVDRKSPWSVLTSEIKIDDKSKESIENQLSLINKEIIDESKILTNMKAELSKNISNQNTIEIASITKDIDNLYKGMDIFISDQYQEPIPIINSGLGSRSWAVFSTIKTLTNYYKERNLNQGNPYLPVLLIEEPEAHIHPQAQRKLLKEITEINGQLIITTHSTYMFRDIDFTNIIHTKLDEGKTKFKRITSDDLPKRDKDLINLKRDISDSNADLLYSNLVVLMEGDTEKYLIPGLFKTYFEAHNFDYGVDFISISGSGERYRPYLNILNILDIPWVIFSDGEEDVVRKLENELKNVNDGGKSSGERDNVFVITNNKNLEQYLVNFYSKDNYLESIINKINANDYREEEYVHHYMRIHQDGEGKKGIIKDYTGDNGVDLALLDILTERKIFYAEALSRHIEKDKIPTKITRMFEYIKKKVGI